MLGQTTECPACNGSIQLPEPQPKAAPRRPALKKKTATYRPAGWTAAGVFGVICLIAAQAFFIFPGLMEKKMPGVQLGSSIVIDEIRITVRGVRLDYIDERTILGNNRSNDKYLIVDLELQNTSPGRIVHLQDIWEYTKLFDNFGNIEDAMFEHEPLFMTSIDGRIEAVRLEPGDKVSDIMVFNRPFDAAQSFQIECDPRFWKSVGAGRVLELSSESFKIEFARNQIR
jgi:hypothetical protein